MTFFGAYLHSAGTQHGNLVTTGKGAYFIPRSHVLATINAVPNLGENLEKLKLDASGK